MSVEGNPHIPHAHAGADHRAGHLLPLGVYAGAGVRARPAELPDRPVRVPQRLHRLRYAAAERRAHHAGPLRQLRIQPGLCRQDALSRVRPDARLAGAHRARHRGRQAYPAHRGSAPAARGRTCPARANGPWRRRSPTPAPARATTCNTTSTRSRVRCCTWTSTSSASPTTAPARARCCSRSACPVLTSPFNAPRSCSTTTCDASSPTWRICRNTSIAMISSRYGWAPTSPGARRTAPPPHIAGWSSGWTGSMAG